MVKNNKLKNEELEKYVISEIKKMLKDECKIEISKFARKVGVSRAYCYNNKRVRSVLDAAIKKQRSLGIYSKQSEIINRALIEENKRLKEQLKKLMANA